MVPKKGAPVERVCLGHVLSLNNNFMKTLFLLAKAQPKVGASKRGRKGKAFDLSMLALRSWRALRENRLFTILLLNRYVRVNDDQPGYDKHYPQPAPEFISPSALNYPYLCKDYSQTCPPGSN